MGTATMARKGKPGRKPRPDIRRKIRKEVQFNEAEWDLIIAESERQNGKPTAEIIRDLSIDALLRKSKTGM